MAQMQRKKKKRKPKYGRIIFSLMLVGLIVYFFVKLAIGYFFEKQVTYNVSVDSLNLEDQYNALVMRNEMLVDTELSGKLNYLQQESAVVERNDSVVELYNDGESIVSAEVTERELNRKMIEFDYNTLEYEINVLKSQILISLENSEYDEIDTLKHDLLLKQERLSKLKEDNRFLVNRNASFSTQTIGNGYLKEGEKRLIQAPAGGLLTFYLDGYESVLTIDNVYNLNISEINKLSFNSDSIVKESTSGGEALFKIVDLSTYYLIVEIDQEDMETYRNIQTVQVYIHDEQFSGIIHDVYSDASNAVAIIKMHEPFDGFNQVRSVPVRIVRENYRGLKIPVSSIINRQGGLGVYALDENRRLKYVPIKVLAYDDESAIIYNEQFYDSENGIVRSISLDQEIIRDASQFNEGDLID